MFYLWHCKHTVNIVKCYMPIVTGKCKIKLYIQCNAYLIKSKQCIQNVLFKCFIYLGDDIYDFFLSSLCVHLQEGISFFFLPLYGPGERTILSGLTAGVFTYFIWDRILCKSKQLMNSWYKTKMITCKLIFLFHSLEGEEEAKKKKKNQSFVHAEQALHKLSHIYSPTEWLPLAHIFGCLVPS